MSTHCDPDGQPINTSFNRWRTEASAVDELIGLCRGVLADGVITDGEAMYLLDWMHANRAASTIWPADVLFERLRRMLVDKKLDLDEQAELLTTLKALIGGDAREAAAILAHAGEASSPGVRSVSTSLPLNDPLPSIAFQGRQFCLTGRFAFGSRAECEEQVVSRGGRAQSGPTKTGEACYPYQSSAPNASVSQELPGCILH